MTEQGSGPAGVPPSSSGSPLRKLLTKTSLVTTVAIVGSLAGVGSFFIDVAGPPAPPPSASVSSPAPGGDQQGAPSGGRSTADSSPPVAASPGGVGQCVTESGDSTACDASHHAEVFAAAGDCTPEALAEYAGGIYTSDVLRVDFKISPVDAVDGCTVIVPAPWTGSIRGGLEGEDHAALRQCHHRLTDRDVSCDQEHTAEVVYSNPDRGSEAIVCSEKADEYMGGSFSRHSAKLDVLASSSGKSMTCSVQAKGNNALIGSVRHLGTTALPLQPLS